MTVEQEQAETIALQAVAFLVQHDEFLQRFLTTAGLAPEDLKTRLHDKDFLGGVLDAFLADDKALLDFCNAAALSPETLMKARRTLPGGDEKGDF